MIKRTNHCTEQEMHIYINISQALKGINAHLIMYFIAPFSLIEWNAFPQRVVHLYGTRDRYKYE